jgi:hypothetical protein
MSGVQQVEFYDGKPSVIATYSNGSTLLFYDGARVEDWDAASGADVEGQVPTSILTLGDKLYATYLSIVGFSGIAEPTMWQAPGVGFGFKNMANQSAGSELLTGMGRYQGLMAVFARRNIQIWYMDPDPLENVQRQVLSNIGTFAPKSIESFGDVDVFFLSDSGVRSLRARDSSNQASSSDVGTPIDDEILAYLGTLTEAEKASAVAVIDPISGRYILAIGQRAYAFSYFASARISAWSRYDFEFPVEEFVSLDGAVWARANDTIYQLGGADGATYDSSTVEVELPYMDGRTVATFKNFTGFDIVAEGEWRCYVNTNPQEPDAWSLVATTTGTTVSDPGISFTGYGPLIKLRLVCEQPGPAKLAKLIVHYETGDAG